VCIILSAALEVNGVQILNGDFFIQGTSQFTAAGNEFEYINSNTAAESIFTTGPLVEPLVLQVHIHNNMCSVYLYTYNWWIKSTLKSLI